MRLWFVFNSGGKKMFFWHPSLNLVVAIVSHFLGAAYFMRRTDMQQSHFSMHVA
jgi:hypothetical protein